MNCPKCNFQQSDDNLECLSCGIVFNKYQSNSVYSKPVVKKVDFIEEENKLDYFKFLILTTKENPGKSVLFGEIALTLFLTYITLRFIFASLNDGYILNSFLHIIILPFHEAGHVFFRIFGRFFMSMGGSLAQLIVPSICVGVFLLKTKDTFGAAVTFWWLGSSFVDLSPYIYDAKMMIMPLVGGVIGREAPYGYHDWHFILNETGLLNSYKGIAYFFYFVGCAIMMVSLVWIFILLKKQYLTIEKNVA